MNRRPGPIATGVIGLIGVIGELAVTAGVLLLAFVAWLLFWTGHTATADAARTVSTLERQWTAAPSSTSVPVPTGPASMPPGGQAFAILRVPRFGADWQMPVLEGTGSQVLRHGVGHYPGTAAPGGIGNLALAGHRTTWAHPFRDIARLRTGDEVSVQTRSARFTYRVTGHQIVSPTSRDVIDPVPGRPGTVPDQALLTLTTCNPEYSARQRWVVHAALVSTVAG